MLFTANFSRQTYKLTFYSQKCNGSLKSLIEFVSCFSKGKTPSVLKLAKRSISFLQTRLWLLKSIFLRFILRTALVKYVPSTSVDFYRLWNFLLRMTWKCPDMLLRFLLIGVLVLVSDLPFDGVHLSNQCYSRRHRFYTLRVRVNCDALQMPLMLMSVPVPMTRHRLSPGFNTLLFCNLREKRKHLLVHSAMSALRTKAENPAFLLPGVSSKCIFD